MKQPPRKPAMKDERDRQIEKDAKVYAMEWMIALTQILTVMCIIKKNPAWKGTLSSFFINLSNMMKPLFEKSGSSFSSSEPLYWFGLESPDKSDALVRGQQQAATPILLLTAIVSVFLILLSDIQGQISIFLTKCR